MLWSTFRPMSAGLLGTRLCHSNCLPSYLHNNFPARPPYLHLHEGLREHLCRHGEGGCSSWEQALTARIPSMILLATKQAHGLPSLLVPIGLSTLIRQLSVLTQVNWTLMVRPRIVGAYVVWSKWKN